MNPQLAGIQAYLIRHGYQPLSLSLDTGTESFSREHVELDPQDERLVRAQRMEHARLCAEKLKKAFLSLRMKMQRRENYIRLEPGSENSPEGETPRMCIYGNS